MKITYSLNLITTKFLKIILLTQVEGINFCSIYSKRFII